MYPYVCLGAVFAYVCFSAYVFPYLHYIVLNSILLCKKGEKINLYLLFSYKKKRFKKLMKVGGQAYELYGDMYLLLF